MPFKNKEDEHQSCTSSVFLSLDPKYHHPKALKPVNTPATTAKFLNSSVDTPDVVEAAGALGFTSDAVPSELVGGFPSGLAP